MVALAHHHVAVVLVVILVLVVLARPQALAVLVVPVLRHTQVAVLDCLVKARLVRTVSLVLALVRAVQAVVTVPVLLVAAAVLMAVAVAQTGPVAVAQFESFGARASRSRILQVKD